MAKYDLAISFAGEQRETARDIGSRLDSSGYSIFFDEFMQAELWGQDLTIAFGDVYAREARWCLLILSQAYVDKPWTNLERQNAIYRFMQERNGYILCLKTDDSRLPGFPDVIGYIDLRKQDINGVYQLLLTKLGRPSHDDLAVQINARDRERAEKLIAACYRRSIFSRMDSEIDMRAMFASIGEAIGLIQSLLPSIGDQGLQHLGLRIIGYLDVIERYKKTTKASISNHVNPKDRKAIDDAKLEIVRLLLEIRRAAAIPIQLPLTLNSEHFWRKEEADQPPTSQV